MKKEELKNLFLGDTQFNIMNITYILLDYLDNIKNHISTKNLEYLTRK